MILGFREEAGAGYQLYGGPKDGQFVLLVELVPWFDLVLDATRRPEPEIGFELRTGRYELKMEFAEVKYVWLGEVDRAE